MSRRDQQCASCGVACYRPYCIKCAQRTPEARAKASAARHAWVARPGNLERARAHLAAARDHRDPAKRKQQIVAAQRKRATDLVAWCPLEYRGDYQRLYKIRGIDAAEARRMIEAQIARDLEAYRRTGVLPQTGRDAHG